MIRYIAAVMNANSKYNPFGVFEKYRTNKELIEFLMDVKPKFRDREERERYEYEQPVNPFRIQDNTVLDEDALYSVLSRFYNDRGGRGRDENA